MKQDRDINRLKRFVIHTTPPILFHHRLFLCIPFYKMKLLQNRLWNRGTLGKRLQTRVWQEPLRFKLGSLKRSLPRFASISWLFNLLILAWSQMEILLSQLSLNPILVVSGPKLFIFSLMFFFVIYFILC